MVFPLSLLNEPQPRVCRKCLKEVEPGRVKTLNSYICAACAFSLASNMAKINGKPLNGHITRIISVPRDPAVERQREAWNQPDLWAEDQNGHFINTGPARPLRNNIILGAGKYVTITHHKDGKRKQREPLIDKVYD